MLGRDFAQIKNTHILPHRAVYSVKKKKMKMTTGFFNLNFLIFYLAKIQKYGQFWNPQNKQIEISKLSIFFEG